MLHVIYVFPSQTLLVCSSVAVARELHYMYRHIWYTENVMKDATEKNIAKMKVTLHTYAQAAVQLAII